MSAKRKIIVICGPTGVGKTGAAIDIAGRFKGEIVNADSMQIYRYMDIGTAKPTPDERARIPHHLVDIVEPDQPFDSALFAKMAGELIIEGIESDRFPFVVGGTGLYIKALIYGLFAAEAIDSGIRRELRDLAKRRGTGYLYEQLRREDPSAAEKIHSNDEYRIVRALEVYRATGKSITTHHHGHQFANPRFDAVKIGLHMDRALLYERIDRRVDKMVAAGLAEEVGALLDRGYAETLKPMQSIGYRQMVDFIKGRASFEEAVRKIKRDTRRYAKRQFTWFRADPETVWFEPQQVDMMIRHIEGFRKTKA